MNTAIISGRLYFTPELKMTDTGKLVTNFTVCVNNPKKASDTVFVDCVAWDKTAEFISKFFEKGKRIELAGSLVTDTYKDKHGTEHKLTKINVDRAEFGESKKAEHDKDRACGDFEEIPDYDDCPF